MFRQQFPISKHNIFNSLQYFLQFKCECNISSLFFNRFRTYKCVVKLFRFISNSIILIKGQETCAPYLHSKQNTCLFIIWSVFDYQTLISELVSDHASLMLLNEPLVNGVQEQCHMATWTLSAVILWFICDRYWQTNGKHLI